MPKAILAVILSDLGADTLRLALGFALALLVAAAFTIASLIVLLEAAVPGAGRLAGPGRSPVVSLLPGGPGPRGSAPPGGSDARFLPGAGNRIVELALVQVGIPYVWGGGSPRSGFDCSGLVQWVYRQVGVDLPRTAQQQFDATVRISQSDLRPGDLVFFAWTIATTPSEPITHVGIYLGNGLMVNAPSEGRPVQVMPAFTGYWGAHYAGPGRVGG